MAKPLLLGAHVSIAGGFDLAPERGQRIGCSVIQLFVKSANQWKARPLKVREAEAFQKNLHNHGLLQAFGHNAYLPNLASPDRSGRSKSVNSLIGEMKRAHRLGLPFLVIHPGAHKGAGEMRGILRISASINRILEKTYPSNVRIALETTAGQGTSVGGRFEHLAQIIEIVEDSGRLGICLDTCHVFAAGYDISTKNGTRKTLRELEIVVGLKRLLAIHLNDSKKGCGSKVDRHTHIGKGMIGQEAFRLIMNDRRLVTVPKVIETPKGKDETLDRRNLRLLKNFVN